MTKRTDDQIPVVPSRGATPSFPARQPERTVTEDAVLQHETPLHKFVHGGMVDSIRRLINVYRSGSTELVDNLFKRGVNNLDDVLDSSIFRRVKLGATDVNGNVDLAGSGWVNKILDNIADGVTYGRPVLTYLSLGKLIKVLRSGADESVDNLFKRGVNTIDDVLDSATFHRTTPNEKTGAGRAFSTLDSSSNAAVTTITADAGTGDSPGTFKSSAAGVGPIVRLQRTATTARVWQMRLETDGSLRLVDETVGAGRITVSPTGLLNVENGNAQLGGSGNIGALELLNPSVSPVSRRLQFGTDGTGWELRIAKNQGGTVTDIIKISDSLLTTFLGAVTIAGAHNLHVGSGSTAETGNPKLEIHGGTGAAGSGRTGSLQVDAANRNLNIGAWNAVDIYVNVGDEADPTTGTQAIACDVTGIVTVPNGTLIAGKVGSQLQIRGGSITCGVFADGTGKMYVADWSTGTKGLKIDLSTGDMFNKDGHNIPGVVVAGTPPSGTALHGTLWCQI